MYKGGYSVLLMTIIMSAVGLVLALNNLATSTQITKNNIDITDSAQSQARARSCTEIVLKRLKAYSFYGGDETLTNEQCRIFTIKNSTNNSKLIQVKSGDFILETKVSQINPSIIIEYQKQIASSNLNQNNPYVVDPTALRLWLKADRAETNNGQPVFNLSNASDDIVSFAQLTTQSNLAPKLFTTAINNRPALRFDGIDDFLTGTTTSIQGNNGLSVIVVGKSNSASTNQTYIGKFDSTNNEREWRLQNDDFIATELANAETANETVSFTNNTNLRIISATWAPNQSSSVSINNGAAVSAITPVTSISTTTEPIIVGASLQGSTSFLNGDIAEILVYNKKLSTTELTKIATYLNTKYNIY